jgi:enamine deaminase RidA (YjgF/YER057c/UK114 family)
VAEREEIRASGLAEPFSHYTDAVRVGDLLFVSGAGFGDIAKVTIFLTNVDDRARINPVREEFFGEARPASTLVEVSRLVLPEFLIEVEAVARLGS